MALGAHLFIPGEKLRPIQAAGMLLAFAGMAAAFAESLWAGGGSLKGDLLCLLGAPRGCAGDAVPDGGPD